MQTKSFLPALLLIAGASAQSGALATLSDLVAYENSAVSVLSAAVATNPIYTPYSSLYQVYTSIWGSLESELATATPRATDPAVSAALASYYSSLGPKISSITAHPFTLPTNSASASAEIAKISSTLVDLAGPGAVQGGSTTSFAPHASPTGGASSNRAPGTVFQLSLMSAAAAGVLGLAAWL